MAVRFYFQSFLFFYPILVGNTLFAQTLSGIVTLVNSGKKPLSGVQIIAANASPAISQSDGKFNLIFIRQTAGSLVHLSAEKNNYEVVNAKELSTILSNSKYDTLRIFMCPAGETDKKRAAYYDINVKKITQRYEDEIAKLKKENRKDKDVVLIKMALDYQLAIEKIKELSEKFALVNFDECSSLYRKAVEYFEQGELDKAIEVLDEDILEETLRKAEQEIILANELDSIARLKLENANKLSENIQYAYQLKYQAELAFQDKVKRLLGEETPDPHELYIIADFSFKRLDWHTAAALFEKLILQNTLYSEQALVQLSMIYTKLEDTFNKQRLEKLILDRH